MFTKKNLAIVSLSLFVVVATETLPSFISKDNTPEKKIADAICQYIDAFSFYIKDTLQPTLLSTGTQDWQLVFLQARRHYKKIEWATEYFTYSTARFVNGPPKAEAELNGQMIIGPSGLQVMEEYIYTLPDSTAKNLLLGQTNIILQKLQVLKAYFSNITIASWQIFDAVKLEVFRIETLGITGFDDQLSHNSIEESALSLQAVQQVIGDYTEQQDSIQNLFKNSISFLLANKNFNTFNRADCIRHYINPITTAIETLRRKLNITGFQYNRLLRQDVFTLFDDDAFNADAYSTLINQQNKSAKIELGKALFNETAFSANNKISCASCHHPQNAFAENLVKHVNIKGLNSIDRNTPTLINAALQPQLFYDQRAETLDGQIADVMHNPNEMGGDLKGALQNIIASGKYKTLFEEAFPGKTQLDSAAVTEALSIYIKSLVKLNSRFDEYMRGNDAALTNYEINGFNLFMGKAKCATCHYMPLFNGVLPPKYITQDAEVLGIPAKQNGKIIDDDRGLFTTLLHQDYYDSNRLLQFDHAFKTVTVRNAAQTFPYMHNGVFKTLQDVMDFYNDGGGRGAGLNVPNQSLSPNKLNLTPSEIKDVIAFIRSLDSQ